MVQTDKRERESKAGSWQKPSFTLIELLVVIVIIMILMSTLLPALKGALEKGRIISCKSNQKQISLGMFVYASSWNGWGPCNDSQMALNTGNRLPYAAYETILWKTGAQKAPVLACPGTDKAWMDNSNVRNVPGLKSDIFFTSSYLTAFGTGIRIGSTNVNWYGWLPANTSTTLGSQYYFKQCPSLNMCGQNVSYTDINGTSYGSQTIHAPSKQPILGEHGGPTGMAKTYLYDSVLGNNNYWVPNNHASGSTVTYADGHQEWVPRTSFSIYYAILYYCGEARIYVANRN